MRCLLLLLVASAAATIPTCTIHADSGVMGTSLGKNESVHTVEDCAAACAANVKCCGGEFVNTTKDCWLTGTGTKIVSAGNMLTGFICGECAAVPTTCALPKGFDRGNYLSDNESSSYYLDECTRSASANCSYPGPLPGPGDFTCSNIKDPYSCSSATVSNNYCGAFYRFYSRDVGGYLWEKLFCEASGQSQLRVQYFDQACQMIVSSMHGKPVAPMNKSNAESCALTGKCSASKPQLTCNMVDPDCCGGGIGCVFYNGRCGTAHSGCVGCSCYEGGGQQTLKAENIKWELKTMPTWHCVDGACVADPTRSSGGTLAECRAGCVKPASGLYTCQAGQCVQNSQGTNLTTCKAICG